MKNTAKVRITIDAEIVIEEGTEVASAVRDRLLFELPLRFVDDPRVEVLEVVAGRKFEVGDRVLWRSDLPTASAVVSFHGRNVFGEYLYRIETDRGNTWSVVESNLRPEEGAR